MENRKFIYKYAVVGNMNTVHTLYLGTTSDTCPYLDVPIKCLLARETVCMYVVCLFIYNTSLFDASIFTVTKYGAFDTRSGFSIATMMKEGTPFPTVV